MFSFGFGRGKQEEPICLGLPESQFNQLVNGTLIEICTRTKEIGKGRVDQALIEGWTKVTMSVEDAFRSLTAHPILMHTPGIAATTMKLNGAVPELHSLFINYVASDDDDDADESFLADDVCTKGLFLLWNAYPKGVDVEDTYEVAVPSDDTLGEKDAAAIKDLITRTNTALEAKEKFDEGEFDGGIIAEWKQVIRDIEARMDILFNDDILLQHEAFIAAIIHITRIPELEELLKTGGGDDLGLPGCRFLIQAMRENAKFLESQSVVSADEHDSADLASGASSVLVGSMSPQDRQKMSSQRFLTPEAGLRAQRSRMGCLTSPLGAGKRKPWLKLSTDASMSSSHLNLGSTRMLERKLAALESLLLTIAGRAAPEVMGAASSDMHQSHSYSSPLVLGGEDVEVPQVTLPQLMDAVTTLQQTVTELKPQEALPVDEEIEVVVPQHVLEQNAQLQRLEELLGTINTALTSEDAAIGSLPQKLAEALRSALDDVHAKLDTQAATLVGLQPLATMEARFTSVLELLREVKVLLQPKEPVQQGYSYAAHNADARGYQHIDDDASYRLAQVGDGEVRIDVSQLVTDVSKQVWDDVALKQKSASKCPSAATVAKLLVGGIVGALVASPLTWLLLSQDGE